MSFSRLTAVDFLSNLSSVSSSPHELGCLLLKAALDDGGFESSVSNCHVEGVDSVVLFDDRATGGGMLRFFFTRHGVHDLHQLYTKKGHFTLGVHNHRYPLVLLPLTGQLVNVETGLSERKTGSVLHQYGFQSALADDDSAAVRTIYQGVKNVSPLEQVSLLPGDFRFMKPAALHTVRVPVEPNSPGTAWLVLEGHDAGLGSNIYSPRDDLTISSDKLYLPMSKKRASVLTQKVLSLAEKG